MSISAISLIKGIFNKINPKNILSKKLIINSGNLSNVSEKVVPQKIVASDVINSGITDGLRNKLMATLGVVAVGEYAVNSSLNKGQKVFSTTA